MAVAADRARIGRHEKACIGVSGIRGGYRVRRGRLVRGWVHPFTSGPASFSFTDTTVWTPVGAGSSGGVGGVAGQTGVSALKHIGVTASFGATTSTMNPRLHIFNQNCAGGANTVCAGFKPNTHVLGDNSFESTGVIELAFSKGLSAFGLTLSNAPPDWGATLTFTDAGADIGNVSLSGLVTCRGTSNLTGCHTPVFLGATVTGQVITGASITLTGAGPLFPGGLFEALPSKIPEPISLSVLGVGLLGLGAVRRRRHEGDPADGSRWSPFGRWRLADSPPDAKPPVK